jgi:hypothetical protein
MYAASIGSEVTPLLSGYPCQRSMKPGLLGVWRDWK